jgi:hypothetical protein
VALVLLVVLPAIIFGVPALLGHAVLLGDDLTQNFPLRVLAGREIRAGNLPLFDPYIWSGAPLLAGWNAGAAYPLTWLFAVLPGAAAWTVNLIVAWAVAGLGMFGFLRALRLTSLASFLGALSFAFAGAMSAQVSHFGLVAGMSWVPLQLLGILRLSQDRPAASRLRWTAVFATATGPVFLAGEPRAIDNACVIVAIYAAWQVARLGRRMGPAAVSIVAGLALGACLGAVQWLPGLAAISTSQRDVRSIVLFNSGSIPVRWLLLTLVPDLLGGSGSLGQPSFFASYNVTEVTSYVGILPLVAAFALLGRLPGCVRGINSGPRLPEWLVWHITALAGVALALGSNTPLGHLLYYLPLFGDQRLQSRSILVLDLALAVLLAYWADQPFRGDREAAGSPVRASRLFRRPAVRRIAPDTVLGLVPPIAAVVVVVLAVTRGESLLQWLGVGISQSADVIGRLRPWLIPYAVLGVGAAALVITGRRLGPGLRWRLITGFVVIDVMVFAILCVFDAGPGLFARSSGGSGSPGSVTGQAATATAPPRSIAALGYPGRFAIYDPDLLDPGDLSGLDPPDVNAISDHAMPSVQGYSSTVDGTYAAATGSHQASGDGQDVLAPGAVADGTLDQLDTAILLTVSEYLVTKAGEDGPATGPPGTGRRDIAVDQRAVWYMGTTSDVSEVEIPDADARLDAAAGTQIGLITPEGSTRWFRARAVARSTLAITVPRPVAAVGVVARAYGAPCPLGPPSVAMADGSVFVANGQLQNALVPPRWNFAGFDGAFAVFANHLAQPPLRIEALPGRSALGAWITGSGGVPAEPTAATVFSPRGARVVRSVAAIAGWSAAWRPQRGPATKLTVQRDGLVQAVDVPPGLGVVTWSYTPPGFPAGLVLSVAALVVVLSLLFLTARWAPRPATDPVSPVHRDGPSGLPSPERLCLPLARQDTRPVDLVAADFTRAEVVSGSSSARRAGRRC